MERFDLQSQLHPWFEHWHRYHWVLPLIKGQVVGDFACGEGYGSALMAQSASQVYAADLNPDTIAQAQNTYQDHHNLRFVATDVCQLPLETDALDVVVSFETLEHLTAHDELIMEFKRVLKPDGLLILSTPDKAIYSGDSDHNEFHVKELEAPEFKHLIEQHFSHHLWFGQRLESGSSINPLQTTSASAQFISVAPQAPEQALDAHELGQHTYLIALASQSESALNQLNVPGFSQYNSSQNQLFKHQESQVKRLLEADQYIRKLEADIEQQKIILNHLKTRLGL